jgi:hypothetical protein
MPDDPLFTSEQIEGRFLDLWDLADRFSRAYFEKAGVSLELDESCLYLIVISTYDDIARYKFYHLSNPYEERSDAVKRAAYLTKWITRFKPWQIVRPDRNGQDGQKASDDTYLVNEIFAVSVAVANLNMHCNRDFFLSIEKEYELVYDLMYRTLSDDALMLLYKTFVDHVNGTTFIEVR